MEREKVIDCMRKAIACDKAKWEVCKQYEYCKDCPYTYAEQFIDVVEAALKLIEEGEKE